MRPLKSRVRRAKFYYSLTKAYFKRYRLRFLATAASLIILLVLSVNVWPNVTRSNVVTIGYTGTYTLETVPAEFLSLATDPLIGIDSAGKPIPALASHWTVSDDGKTYVVFLKDNLKWHDGTTVDAKDITIAIDNVTVTALNNKAIEFKLPNPISSFPLALNKPVFKAKSFYGTGKYRIVDIKRRGEIIQKISLSPNDESLPSVDIKFYPTEIQLQNAIKMGEVKYASVANAKEVQEWPNMNVKRVVEEEEIVTIFYNTQDNLLSSKEFRQGLNHAIDRSMFDGEPAHSPNFPSSWVYNENVKRYDFNIGKAKELISKSEIGNPKIVLSVVGGLDSVAQSIKEDWEEVGIEVEIKNEETIPKDFQALLAVNRITSNPDQYGLWHSTQKETNLTKLNDPKIDKLLEDARIEQDEEKRKKLYQDFQRFLVDEAPAAFLYHPYKYEVIYKNTQNLISKLPQSI